MSVSTKKEIAKSLKTLIVMLQSLRDQQVSIVLRNDTVVTGTIVRVDASMNVELKNAKLESDPFYQTQPTKQNKSATDNEPQTSSSTDHDDTKKQTHNLSTSIHASRIDQSHLGGHRDDGYTECHSRKLLTHDNDEDDPSCDNEESDCSESRHISKGDEHLDLSKQHYFVVKGSRIRYIDLPSDHNLIESAKAEIERIRNKRKQWNKRDIIRPAGSKLVSD